MILYHGSNVNIEEINLSKSDVGFQIRRLLAGIITIDDFIEELKYKKGITFQYFFATEHSIKYLKRI